MANYTAIATGADANAATFNAPLAQLDTAIGVLASLVTTDKDSVVDAINEAVGKVGTLSSLTTTDKDSLVDAVNEVRNSALVGGIYVTQAQLKAWTEAVAFEATAITPHGTYPLLAASATVKWPDGSAGTYTAVTINEEWQGVDAYTVTHTTSGYTVTQAAVTRNIDGMVTTKPALTIA